MKIIETSGVLTPTDQYLMTKSPSIKTVTSIPDNTEMKVASWLTFLDTNAKGQESEMLSIMGDVLEPETEELVKTVWCCQSATFKRNFFDLWELFSETGLTMKKISGITKAGKEFVNCDLAV